MASEVLAALLPPLKPLATATAFDDFACACARVAAGRLAPGEASKLATTRNIAKSAQDALTSLFLEATKVAIPTEELVSVLVAVLPSDRARTVAVLASDLQALTHTSLESLSLGPAELIDVTWERANKAAANYVRPRSGGMPFYIITFVLRATNGSTRSLQFTANAEELTDVVWYAPCPCAPKNCV